MKLPNPKAQQKLVDDWNSKHPVGTPVTRYKLINPLREPQQTETRSEAWLMGGHTAMVLVNGVSGGVMVESVAAMPNVQKLSQAELENKANQNAQSHNSQRESALAPALC